MKNYMCFCWEYYEPQGGMNDFIGSCDTLEEALELTKLHFYSFNFTTGRGAMIFNLSENKVERNF